MVTVNFMNSGVVKLPSEHYGLLWKPSCPGVDHIDHFGEPQRDGPPCHFSPLVRDTVLDALSKLESPKLIVEIGVDASYGSDDSSTRTLLEWKPESCVYIGIDINDKSHIADEDKNIYTLQNSSAEKDKLYDLMDELSLEEIDFMFVDGFHSINEVLWEWEYWEKMISKGIMAFHDTTYHPGPIAVLAAADPNIFEVTYYGRDRNDWGVGVVQRKEGS